MRNLRGGSCPLGCSGVTSDCVSDGWLMFLCTGVVLLVLGGPRWLGCNKVETGVALVLGGDCKISMQSSRRLSRNTCIFILDLN